MTDKTKGYGQESIGELIQWAVSEVENGASPRQIVWTDHIDRNKNLVLGELSTLLPMAEALTRLGQAHEQRGYEKGHAHGAEQERGVNAWQIRKLQEEQRAIKVPRLKIKSIPQYIAAVAAATERGALDGKAANAMLYAAQLLIAAARLGDIASSASPTRKKPAARARETPDRSEPLTLEGSSSEQVDVDEQLARWVADRVAPWRENSGSPRHEAASVQAPKAADDQQMRHDRKRRRLGTKQRQLRQQQAIEGSK